MKYEKYKDNESEVCVSGASGDKERLPTGHIKLPKGMAGVKLGDEVIVTVRGIVKGFSTRDWDNCSEIELELHDGDVKSAGKEDNVFSDMAEDD